MTPEGLVFLDTAEGFRGMPYDDATGRQLVARGKVTIGIGTECPISLTEAQLLRNYRLQPREDAIHAAANAAGLTLTNHQFDALGDWSYNFDVDRLLNSDLWDLISHGGSVDDILHQFRLWVHAGGAVNSGLVKRREGECRLWKQPDADTTAIPLDLSPGQA